MDKSVFSKDVIDVLRGHLRSRLSPAKRPILIFSCGGCESDHAARRRLQEFVATDENDVFRNVFFLKAENLANDPAMNELDLLAQEAILVDIADWLVIFAESVGTFCELGAFASLPHSVSITSVVVDKSHQHDDSFLIRGPVRVIDKCRAPLSQVFFSDLDCPMLNGDFSEIVNNIREYVKDNEAFWVNKGRKTLNSKQRSIHVGPLAHELLDLVTLFGPINEADLMELYCEIKHFDRKAIRIVSTVLSADMRSKTKIEPTHLLVTLRAMNLIGAREDPFLERPLYYSKIRLEDYFMFKETDESDFANMRALVLLKRRKRGREFEKDLYRRFDSN